MMQIKLIIYKILALQGKEELKMMIFLFLLSIVVSIVEMAGISVIMPFISVASDFSLIHRNLFYQDIYKFFDFHSAINFVVSFGIVLIVFYMFRSLLNLFYYYLLSSFTDGRYQVFAYQLFQNYLALPYENYVKKNSSIMTKTIVNEAENLTQLLSHSLLLVSEFFVALLIYSVLLYIDWRITLILSVVLIIKAIFFLMGVGKKIRKQGEKREYFQQKFYSLISSTFGNFKLIKLMGRDREILKKVDEAARGFAHANIVNRTLSHLPRLMLEAVGFGVIAFVITYLVWENQSDIHGQLGMISMFVLGLYRLMPSFNRMMSSYNLIQFYYKSLEIVHTDLLYADLEKTGNLPLAFERRILLNHVSFGFNDHSILDDVTFEIHKGARIGIIGESGSGKSTLVDLLMGLYKPKQGSIFIDETLLDDDHIRAWRTKIGYIPQQIYLFDGTVAENIVFGRDYNENKLKEILKSVSLWDFLSSKDGLLTWVGEGGVMLSGGQKQRIAIARALYGDPEILIFDEATASLDHKTEVHIMREIYALSREKTLIIVAHRTSTLHGCDEIFKVHDKKVFRCKKEDMTCG